MKRLLSVTILVCMLISLLPTHCVLAVRAKDDTVDISSYLQYGSTVPNDYKGHIYTLSKADEDVKEYDYSLLVSARNTYAAIFYSTFKYDSTKLEIVSVDGDALTYDPSDETTNLFDLIEFSKPNKSMTTSSSALKCPINEKTTSLVDISSDDLTFYYNSDNQYYYAGIPISPNSSSVSTWTVDTTGSKIYKSEGTLWNYQLPTNVTCDFYTIYFKLKDGVSEADLDANSLRPYFDDANTTYGADEQTTDSDDQAIIINSGAYLVGFPEPDYEPVKVNFQKVQNKSESPLEGVEITLYTDAACQTIAKTKDGETDLKGTTTSDGTLTIENVPAAKTYYYKATKDGYANATGSLDVSTSDLDVSAITMPSIDDLVYDTVITVIDADTDALIEGAEVKIDDNTAGTTDASGKVTSQQTAKEHKVDVSKSGYKAATDSVTVNTNGGSKTIKLVPERVTVNIPAIKDANGDAIQNVDIQVKKVTSATETKAWSDTTVKSTDGSATTVEVPKNSTVSLTYKATGYGDVTIYAKNDGTTVKLYKDAGCSDEFSEDVTMPTMSEAFYDVNITVDNSDTSKYTATVTLNNIKATHGTYGIRYDKDLFEINTSDPETNGFKINDTDIKLFDNSNILEDEGYIAKGEGTNYAYHVFTWAAKNADNPSASEKTYVNDGTQIATYTFKLKDGKTAAEVRADSFGVMPFDKTAAGVEYIGGVNRNDDEEIAYANEFLSQLWRYVDEENNEPLGNGRLAKDLATENGFYQVARYSDAVMCDVKTEISFVYPAENSALIFQAVDDFGFPVSGVEVNVYGTGVESQTLTTDATGMITIPVDISADAVTYNYTASCNGYWNVEEGTATVDSENSPKVVNLIMLEKVYHETIVRDSEASNPADPTATKVPNVDLGGEKFAYNGRDYHFTIKPAEGYKYDGEAPSSVDVYVKNVETDEYDKFTANFDTANNVYVLDGDNITGLKNEPITADENGFKSSDIYVAIDASKIVPGDDIYTVEAFAGQNGKVTYEANSSAPTQTADPNTESQITVSNIAPNEDSGEFTFTANEGYKVEKVLINGVAVETYKDKESFTYKFEDVTADSSIAVTFWDGKTPSTDSFITLVVGDKGSVDVSSPSAVTGIKNERKVFYFASNGSVEFTATPIADHVVNKVVKKDGNGDETEVSLSSEKYTVTSAAGEDVVVYVSFKHKDADDTANVFVTSYVHSGEGTITPVGELIYNKYDSPTFTMTRSDGYMLTGVMLNDTNEVKFGSQQATGTYTLNSLIKNTKIGAIFSEEAYGVQGIIDFSQAGAESGVLSSVALASNTGATVKFVRVGDQMTITTVSSNSRQNSTFTAQVPSGTWTVTVSKPGYLNYVIQKFVVADNAGTIYFGDNEGTTPKPIVPLIGDTTGKGSVVSLEDAGVVSSAFRSGANETITQRADVDDSGAADITDMTFVKANYSKRQVKTTYDAFCAE